MMGQLGAITWYKKEAWEKFTIWGNMPEICQKTFYRPWELLAKNGPWENTLQNRSWEIFAQNGSWEIYVQNGSWELFVKMGCGNFFPKICVGMPSQSGRGNLLP